MSKKLSFQSKLESISKVSEYYAVPVPAQITRKLGTHAAVPILARINGATPFRGSLYPVGGGRHAMRVKASARKDAGIQGGDRVRVQIEVVDRKTETTLPKDLAAALKAEGVLEDFKKLPAGKLSYTLRWIDQAAKPETRKKRIADAVEEGHRAREKRVDRG